MATPQRPGEITYYEELGVENTATQEQIRDAYRALVRLLHPDQQTDPQLREAAELQMRKLNRIHAVLSDAVRRIAYDESLATPHPVTAAPVIVVKNSEVDQRKLLIRAGAVGALVFGTFLLIWFMVTSNNSDARVPDARAASGAKSSDATDDDPGEQIARLREQLRTAESERDDALEQLVRLSGKKPAESTDTAKPQQKTQPISTTAVMTELPGDSGSAQSSSSSALSSGPRVSASDFAGEWVFSKSGSASSGGKSEYPPEYIQVTVTERNGFVQGQYRSRYQVLDHGVSPDVDFAFTGTPSNGALSCSWQGSGGARGHMTMRILPSSTVELAWNVTDLGSQQWLKTGTATLIRK